MCWPESIRWVWPDIIPSLLHCVGQVREDVPRTKSQGNVHGARPTPKVQPSLSKGRPSMYAVAVRRPGAGGSLQVHSGVTHHASTLRHMNCSSCQVARERRQCSSPLQRSLGDAPTPWQDLAGLFMSTGAPLKQNNQNNAPRENVQSGRRGPFLQDLSTLVCLYVWESERLSICMQTLELSLPTGKREKLCVRAYMT